MVGDADEVEVGAGDGDVFGEGSPGGEAGLVLMGADLGVAFVAVGAGSAGADEGGGDAVADVPLADFFSEGVDGAGEFVSADVGK